MSEQNSIEHLLLRYLQELSSAQEIQRIEAWAEEDPANQKVLDQLRSGDKLKTDLKTLFLLVDSESGKKRMERMHRNIKINTGQHLRPKVLTFLPYVAALLIATIGITWVVWKNSSDPSTLQQLQTQILPATNQATLHFSDGRTIALRDVASGIVMDDRSVSYQDGSSLTELSADQRSLAASEKITLSTPQGGTYQVTLSDGTKVWLNAGSKLHYPIQFQGQERIVELEGEAYFEVSKARTPFKVWSQGQEVKVLGTHFNIRSYPESEVLTTLLEGSVEVRHKQAGTTMIRLSPGEEAVLHANRLSSRTADLERAVSWRQGDFLFRGMSTQEALMEIGRWYNVEMIFSERAQRIEFVPGGIISRHKKLSEVLGLFKEGSALQFNIQGRRVYVN